MNRISAAEKIATHLNSLGQELEYSVVHTTNYSHINKNFKNDSNPTCMMIFNNVGEVKLNWESLGNWHDIENLMKALSFIHVNVSNTEFKQLGMTIGYQQHLKKEGVKKKAKSRLHTLGLFLWFVLATFLGFEVFAIREIV